MNIPE